MYLANILAKYQFLKVNPECENNTKVHKEVYTFESPSKFYIKYSSLGIGF